MTRPRSLEFPSRVKRAAYDRAKGACEACGIPLVIGKIAYDHILPVALGGEPVIANCRCICTACHKAKTAADIGRIRKADRQKVAVISAKPAAAAPIRSRGFDRKPRQHKRPLPPRQLYEDAR